MKVSCISDSPKLTSGFGNVAAEIYKGFYEDPEIELSVFGILDFEPDYGNKLPYNFWPTHSMDLMGHSEAMNFVWRTNPDIVWIMIDPGNLIRFVASLLTLRERKNMDFKIMAYVPVEGLPISEKYLQAFSTILEDGGSVTLWCESAKKAVETQSGFELDYIHFGSDHAGFKHYSEEQRKKLRQLVGFDGHFIIGSVGVNKRTKGYDKLIYVADILRENGWDKGIKFYCHTEADRPVMQGYDLHNLSSIYGVSDMFLWKPTRNVDRGNEYLGIPRNSNILDELDILKRPDTKEGRKEMWQHYDFVTRLNCLDMYLDTSQVEGWGLPVGEAMACGVPTFIPKDYHVRDEVFAPGCHQYDSLPVNYWDTWHTGARLVNFDVEQVANMVNDFKNNNEYLQNLVEKGTTHINNYKWDTTRRQMVEKVKELYVKKQ